jgi:hypothetical protein
LLVAAVIGSGIMAAKLAGGNTAIALLCNTLATGAILVVIITIFAPISVLTSIRAVSLVMADHHSRLRALPARCGRLCCRSLHHVGLLVHRVYVLR